MYFFFDYTDSFFHTCFLRLDLGARINTLPKESRLVLTVFGLKVIEAESKVEQPQYIREAIGWAAIQCFSFEGYVFISINVNLLSKYYENDMATRSNNPVIPS